MSDQLVDVLREIRDAIRDQAAVGRECAEMIKSAKTKAQEPDPDLWSESVPSVDYLGIHTDLNAGKEVLLYSDRLLHFLLECNQRGVDLRVQLTMSGSCKAVLKRVKQ